MSQAAAATEPEWARTDADPSDAAEPGTESTARNPLRPDTDNDEEAELSAPKRPLNRNVKITLCYQPSLNVCTSLATASPLAAYVLLRTGSNAPTGTTPAVRTIPAANVCGLGDSLFGFVPHAPGSGSRKKGRRFHSDGEERAVAVGRAGPARVPDQFERDFCCLVN